MHSGTCGTCQGCGCRRVLRSDSGFDKVHKGQVPFRSRQANRSPCPLFHCWGEKGSADAARDPCGFAVKFYTEDGNYGLTGNSTPVFFIRAPLKFPDFVHTQKRNPATNCKDPDMFGDFFSLTPESIHQVTILFSDRGVSCYLPEHEWVLKPHLQVVYDNGE